MGSKHGRQPHEADPLLGPLGAAVTRQRAAINEAQARLELMVARAVTGSRLHGDLVAVLEALDVETVYPPGHQQNTKRHRKGSG